MLLTGSFQLCDMACRTGEAGFCSNGRPSTGRHSAVTSAQTQRRTGAPLVRSTYISPLSNKQQPCESPHPTIASIT